MTTPAVVEAESPSPYPPLITMYSLLALYGLASGFVGVSTIDVVAGQFWGLAWPFLIALTSLGALAGLLRSKLTRHHAVEVTTTLSLVGLLVTYSLFILVRTVLDGDAGRLPVAILPIVISVFPYFRLARIVRGVRR